MTHVKSIRLCEFEGKTASSLTVTQTSVLKMATQIFLKDDTVLNDSEYSLRHRISVFADTLMTLVTCLKPLLERFERVGRRRIPTQRKLAR